MGGDSLEVNGVLGEAVNQPGEGKTGLLNNFVILVPEKVGQNWNSIHGKVEAVLGHAPADIGSGGDGGPLDTRGKEVQEGKDGHKTPSPENRSGVIM